MALLPGASGGRRPDPAEVCPRVDKSPGSPVHRPAAMNTNHTSTRQRPSGEQIPDRPHRDRGHRHRHGTRAAYTQDGCKCPSCQRANRTAHQVRGRAIAYGRWHPFTDAEPVSAHLTELLDSGISLATGAARAPRQPRHASRAAVHPPRGDPAQGPHRHSATHPASHSGQPAPSRRGQHRRERSPPRPHRQRLVHGSARHVPALPPLDHLPTPARHHHHRQHRSHEPRHLHPAGRPGPCPPPPPASAAASTPPAATPTLTAGPNRPSPGGADGPT